MDEGAQALSDTELLAVLIGTGVRGASALQVAQTLLGRFDGPGAIERAGVAELRRVPGIGPVAACTIKAALALGRRAVIGGRERGAPFLCARHVASHYGPLLGGLETEVFHGLLLDARHRRLRDVRISAGSINACPVRPAEAFSFAVRERAKAVIFVHNHPSGDVTPSAEDMALTERLMEAGRLLGIEVLDHVIVAAADTYYSFADRGC